MLAYDAIADAQPQACALPNFLRGEKWIEDALGILNALAIVAEQDFHPAAVMNSLNFNQPRPACSPNRVIGIIQNVEEYLLQLVRVPHQLRQAVIKLFHDLHTVIGEVIGAQSNRLAQNFIDLHRLALWRTLPGKAQQVLHDFFCALRFFENYLQVLARAAWDFWILH